MTSRFAGLGPLRLIGPIRPAAALALAVAACSSRPQELGELPVADGGCAGPSDCAEGHDCLHGACRARAPDPAPASAAIRVTPAELDFGAAPLGVPATRELRVASVGATDLEVHLVSVEKADAADELAVEPAGDVGWSLAPGTEQVVRVTLRARDAEPDVALVRIVSGDPQRPVVAVPVLARVEGEARLGWCVLAPGAAGPDGCAEGDALDFGTLEPGAEAVREVALWNAGTGNRPLLLAAARVAPTGTYQLALLDEDGAPASAPALLPPGSEAAWRLARVTARAGAAGPLPAGTLTIDSDDAAAPARSLALSGVVACPAGRVDANGEPADGCERSCPAPAAEVCDGVDQDCDGVPDDGARCDAPPAAACLADGVTLRRWLEPGLCLDGRCHFSTADRQCPFGCAEDACAGDPCAERACDQPPPPACPDDDHLLQPVSLGACVAGDCRYPTVRIPCPFGCAAGACRPDPCAGVACVTPPDGECLDDDTERRFASVGLCLAGECVYAASAVDCDLGCDDATGRCVAVVRGCTDPTATNFDPQANTDDGSCVLPFPCAGLDTGPDRSISVAELNACLARLGAVFASVQYIEIAYGNTGYLDEVCEAFGYAGYANVYGGDECSSGANMYPSYCNQGWLGGACWNGCGNANYPGFTCR